MASRIKIFSAVTAALAICALIAALKYPLYRTDIVLPNDRPLLSVVLSSEDFCSNLSDGTVTRNSFAGPICESIVEPYTDLIVNQALLYSIGPVANELSWGECRKLALDESLRYFNGAVVPGSPIERCVKLAIANLLGVRLGDTNLVDVLGRLYGAGDFLLFSAVLLFGLLLPLIKILSLAFAATLEIKDSNSLLAGYLGAAHTLGKWSMTDVFVVSIIIVNLKLNTLGLQVSTGMGLYFLFFSGIASSVGIHILLRGFKTSSGKL